MSNPWANTPLNPLYVVRRTEFKGMGCFATRDIQAGERVFGDKCILARTFGETSPRSVIELNQKFRALSPEGQRQVLDLSSSTESSVVSALRNLLSGRGLTPEEVEEHIQVERIFECNNFEVVESRRDEHGKRYPPQCGLFIQASRLNHSCEPNLTYTATTIPGFWVAVANRPIKKDEELTISYIPICYTRERRQQELLGGWGFSCLCPRCQGQDNEYDAQLEEAARLQGVLGNDITDEAARSSLPHTVFDERTKFIERRIELLNALQRGPELFFAYSDAALYYEHLASKDEDAARAAAFFRACIRVQSLAVDTATQLWTMDNAMTLDASSFLQIIEAKFRRFIHEIGDENITYDPPA